MSIAPLDMAGVHFEDLPDQAWPRQEIFDGGLHVTPFVGLPHQNIVGNVFSALRAVAPPEYKVYENVNVLRRGHTDRLLIPDVGVLDRSASEGHSLFVAPEAVCLAVEVVSPSSRAMGLHFKKQLYAEWGIGSYWVLDPDTQEFHEFGHRDRGSSWLSQIDPANFWLD